MSTGIKWIKQREIALMYRRTFFTEGKFPHFDRNKILRDEKFYAMKKMLEKVGRAPGGCLHYGGHDAQGVAGMMERGKVRRTKSVLPPLRGLL